MNRLLLTMLLALLLGTAPACKHDNKTEQLAALDNAYQAGLLTKDEYEAKKLALTKTEAKTGAGTAPPQTPAPVPIPSPPPAPPTSAPVAIPPPSAEIVQPPPKPAPALAPRRANAPPAAPLTPAARPPSDSPVHQLEPAPVAGCEDAEYKSGGQKGAEERFFAASPEMVRRAAVSAFDSLDFNIHKNSDKEIEASKRRHLGVIVGAGGERVILRFKKTEHGGQSGTRVIGETKKNFVGHVSQRTWTDAVLAEIACKLHDSSR